MSQCVQLGPNNTLIFTPDLPSACQGYLLLSPQEVASMQSVFVPLSISDGLAISTAIIGLWGAAWLWATVNNFVNSRSGENS